MSAATLRVVHFPFWLGDFIMALPLARAFAAKHAGDRLVGVLDASLAPLLQRSGLPIEPWAFGKRQRRALLTRLRRERPAEVVLLTNSLGSIWPYFLARVPERRGFGSRFSRRLLTRPCAMDMNLPQGERNLALIEFPAGDSKPTPLARVPVDRGTPPFLMIFPGAQYGPAKFWGAERFAAVGQLAMEHGWQVGVFGSSGDAAEAKAVSGKLGHRRCVDYSGTLSLEGLLQFMERTTNPIALTNDSGALHLCAAAGVPSAGLYLSTNARRTPPAFGSFKLIEADIECRPCYRRQCPFGHYQCRERLEPARIFAELEALQAGRLS